MLNIAIVGFGNVGKCAYDAIQAAPDMNLTCIIEAAPQAVPPAHLAGIWLTDIKDIHAHGKIDAALLCLPSRMCPDVAETLLRAGLNTVDSYDIHGDIWDVKCRLDKAAKEGNASGIISAGWDPGSDSVMRALMEAMAPRGITYTNFGPGMSMGHSVAAKAVDGVANALSVTLPLGAGVHRRMVYVQLEPGAVFEDIARAIKADPYFTHDETHVRQTDNVMDLLDAGHGVQITRKGVSGSAHNQLLEYSMRINGPALTAQIMVGAARAACKQPPGCYTLIEVPMVDLLPGTREELVRKLV